MKIGVPKEIKTLEFRVGMTPAGVHEVVSEGMKLLSRKMLVQALALLAQITRPSARRSSARQKKYLLQRK